MRSVDVLVRRDPEIEESPVNDLLVLWQHPQTREMVPIGRFARRGDTFSFAYTQAAAAVPDFRPLPGLNHLSDRYESTQIPRVFGQRVMEPDRPDYIDYLATIGLDPERATPWEQIVQSGGTRAGDTLQFMQVPSVTAGRARARFFANGVRHVPGPGRSIAGRFVVVSEAEHEAALAMIRPGMSLLLQPEEHNQYDPNAALVTFEGVPLGWVPRAMTSSIRELMEHSPVEVSVLRVGDRTTPAHLRLVLDLNTPAPDGFVFDREGRWDCLDAQ